MSLTDSWWSVGVLAGTARLDDGLGDYQWNVAPRAAYGIEALAGRAWWSAGVRGLRTAARQEIADAAGVAPVVRGTSLEMVARARAARVAGMDVTASASGGLLRWAWDPDRVQVETAPGSSTTVALKPVSTWVAGAGLGVERPIAAAWRLGLVLERRMFALETARRRGEAVTIDTETFGDWSARLGLARVWSR